MVGPACWLCSGIALGRHVDDVVTTMHPTVDSAVESSERGQPERVGQKPLKSGCDPVLEAVVVRRGGDEILDESLPREELADQVFDVLRPPRPAVRWRDPPQPGRRCRRLLHEKAQLAVRGRVRRCRAHRNVSPRKSGADLAKTVGSPCGGAARRDTPTRASDRRVALRLDTLALVGSETVDGWLLSGALPVLDVRRWLVLLSDVSGLVVYEDA